MTTLAIGNRRLLRLATILDTADARHRANKEPTYDQGAFIHPCRTPACALGHWAAHNRRRWKPGSHPILRNDADVHGPMTSAEKEFALVWHQAEELFGVNGCGEARTAKQAARYIRKFVTRRQTASK